MKFTEMFGNSSARWIKYSEYDARQADDGEWFVLPSPDATPAVYDPIENAETMIVDALNIGLKCMSNEKQFYDDNRLIADICVFAEKYGLLGFMTALPTTPDFIEYETAYFQKNRFLRAESIPSIEYAKLFFPFENVLNTNPNPYHYYTKKDGALMASLAARSKPKAMEMTYQREYTESYKWLKTQFSDWELMFCASFLYYELEQTDPELAVLQREAIAAFDGNVPSFHIELFDTPTIVWDFKSLMTIINVVFGLMLADKAKPLRSCKFCNRAFIATHPKAEFCEYKCKNKYNVYKNREKK